MGYYKRYHPEIKRDMSELNNYRKLHGKMTKRYKHLDNEKYKRALKYLDKLEANGEELTLDHVRRFIRGDY